LRLSSFITWAIQATVFGSSLAHSLGTSAFLILAYEVLSADTSRFTVHEATLVACPKQ